jgi:hypothetical protein
MNLVLITYMKKADKQRLHDGGTFESTDPRCPDDVREFCKILRLPLLGHFTCACAFDDAAPRGAIAKSYGECAAHLDLGRVLPDIAIVCDGDLQTVAHNAMRHLDPRGHVPSKYREPVIFDGPLVNRLEKLVMHQGKMGPDHYIEVRIGRAISKDDVSGFATD